LIGEGDGAVAPLYASSLDKNGDEGIILFKREDDSEVTVEGWRTTISEGHSIVYEAGVLSEDTGVDRINGGAQNAFFDEANDTLRADIPVASAIFAGGRLNLNSPETQQFITNEAQPQRGTYVGGVSSDTYILREQNFEEREAGGPNGRERVRRVTTYAGYGGENDGYRVFSIPGEERFPEEFPFERFRNRPRVQLNYSFITTPTGFSVDSRKTRDNQDRWVETIMAVTGVAGEMFSAGGMNYGALIPISGRNLRTFEIDLVWEAVPHPVYNRSAENQRVVRRRDAVCWGPIGGKVKNETFLNGNNSKALLTPILEYIEEATNFLAIMDPWYNTEDVNFGSCSALWGREEEWQTLLDEIKSSENVTHERLAELAELSFGKKHLEPGIVDGCLAEAEWDSLADLMNRVASAITHIVIIDNTSRFYLIADAAELSNQLRNWNYRGARLEVMWTRQNFGFAHHRTNAIETPYIGRQLATRWFAGTGHPDRAIPRPQTAAPGFSIRENTVALAGMLEKYAEYIN
jgi:hypothetical protein